MSEHIKIWTEKSVGSTLAGRIRLDRPEALHAMDQAMVRIINSAFRRWHDDDDIAMILIDHAPGSRGFCAGGDIRKLAAARSPEIVASFVADECEMSTLAYGLAKPCVAVIDGVVMGAGLGLTVHGSHRIATENTRLAMPEVGIGLFPDTGVAWHLARLPDRIGVWMAMTGARLTGAQAYDVGLATHYLGADHIEEVKTALVARGPGALEDYATPVDEGFSLQRRKLIASMFAGDNAGSIEAALRASSDPWAREQAAILATKCPMSIRVALRHVLGSASGDDFDALMRVEHALVCSMAARADFREGVRAAIIDKDAAPSWSPAHSEDISDTLIDEVFAYRPRVPFSPA